MNVLFLLLMTFVAGVQCSSLIPADASMAATDQGAILLSSDVRVYQSDLYQSITITGSGFESDLSLQTYPPLTVKEDYVLTVTSPTSATLYLVPRRQWRDAAGPLLVQSVKSGGVERKLSDVHVATVLENPAIFYATATGTESKLREFTIHGEGFTDGRLTNLSFSAANKTATLCATSIINSYVLIAEPCNQHPIEGAWNTAVDMRITAIDTGAGAVPTNVPVAALINADKPEIVGGERSGDSIPYEDDYYSSGENTDDQHYIFGSDSEDLPLTSYITKNLKSAASQPPVQPRRALHSLGSAAGSGDISVMLTVHEVSSLFLLLLVMLCAALLLVRCCQKTHLNKLKSTSSEDLIV